MCSQSNLIEPALIPVNVEFEPPPFVSYVAVLGACGFLGVEDQRGFVVAATVNQVTYFEFVSPHLI